MKDQAFAQYAAWYNAFNKGKDYAAEASYVFEMAQRVWPAPRSWLDVGCGTGDHLACLSSRGLTVAGVDISPAMLAQAKLAHPGIPFFLGSAQDFRVPGPWDVVGMLFHVMSYQTSDSQVQQALGNISAHLNPGGVLVFDFWNTEGVLRDPPSFRTRETLVGERRMFRLSRPLEDRRARLVQVHYEFRWDSTGGELAHEEQHSMRHFSPDELDRFLSGAGFAVLECKAWMRDRAPTSEDWYGVICARNRGAP